MPRIPRLRGEKPEEPSSAEQTPADAPDSAPQDQPTTQFAPGDAPTTQLPALSGAVSAGDPTAPAAVTSGDPLAAPAPGPGVPADGVPTAGGTDTPEPIAERPPAAASPGFAERARMRRRLRYLRRLRELAFRDLGGLVFDLHRFGRRRDELVLGKLDALAAIDTELRALETALDDRRTLLELREPGIAACPRCATLHGSDANFCPGCGTPLRGTVVRSAGAVSIAPADPAAPQPDPVPAPEPTAVHDTPAEPDPPAPQVEPVAEPQRRDDEPPAAAPPAP